MPSPSRDASSHRSSVAGEEVSMSNVQTNMSHGLCLRHVREALKIL